ncbi:MAG: SDR family oxidoreductase [Pseudomonadota bacterium]
MTDTTQQTARHTLSAARLALACRERVPSAVPWVRCEPVAIVGIGCRFPGADGPEAFLALLREGREAIGELPPSRWSKAQHFDADPEAPGKTYVTRGGYLDDVTGFDAAQFGISRAEAQTMDPQQRLLLEVSLHALEHAAIAPESLYEEAVGVFVGVSSADYAALLRDRTALSDINGYVSTGNAFSVAAGRISYALGLKGPSLAVDTACSSSLVAVHLAMQSLQLRECRMALAGGVNLLLRPESTIDFAKARMLAPDGRVKAYDAAADGFVRGEGCGVVALKRLSDAIADGDDVWAVLRGSAVNQDGPSSGLTAPNGTAQRAVLRAALEAAGVEARQLAYVEGHGTGTALGDPIELGALAEVYGRAQGAGQRLRLGTVKANVGHLESAAGVAGLIRAVLTLRHREVFTQLNFNSPSKHIDWDDSGLEVAREPAPLQARDGRWLAAVSSFGFSGTNAHVVLEAAPDLQPVETRGEGPALVVLGGRDKGRVDALASRWADAFEGARPDQLATLARTAWTGRDRGVERIAATAHDGAELAAALRAAVAGTRTSGAWRGRVRTGTGAGKLAFLYPGQGTAWAGMGLHLREHEPAFRDALARCEAVLGRRAVLDPSAIGEDTPIDTGALQPALFAFQVAMTELFRSRGVVPDFVLGHSVGELTAAWAADVLDLEDAARLVLVRADQLSALPAGGKMVAVVQDPRAVEAAVRQVGGTVAVAVYNGPRQVVISGADDDVDRVLAVLGCEDTRTLAVSHAFHSPLMAPAADALREAVASIKFRPPRTPLVSSRTGQLAGSEVGQPEHWVRQLLEPVRFTDAVDALWMAGTQEFVEIGPGSALTGLVGEILSDDAQVLAVSAASKRRGEAVSVLDAVAALSVRRADRDLSPWLGEGPRSADAPRTPLQRTRFWPEPVPAAQAAPATTGPDRESSRPPVTEWGWTPSFRRLPPAPWMTPSSDLLLVLEGERTESVLELLDLAKQPAKRCTFASLEALLAAEEGTGTTHLVVAPPADDDRQWAAQVAQVLAGSPRAVTLTLLTAGAYEVTGLERLDPTAAAAAAAAAVLGQEFDIPIRIVDLDAGVVPQAQPLAYALRPIAAEDAGSEAPRAVAFRGPHRWALTHVPAPLDGRWLQADGASGAPPVAAAPARAVAVVGALTTGLGERIARFLVVCGVQRVVLIGPSSEASGSANEADARAVNDGQAQAVERLRQLAGDPDRIVSLSADVGDRTQLRQAIDAAEHAHGRLQAVIHAGATGRPEIARLLMQAPQVATHRVLRERIDGMPALAHALEGRSPAYVLVITSLSAHVGGVGFADYAAANAYAESYVRQHAANTGAPWFSVGFEALADELGDEVARLEEGELLRQSALTEEELQAAFSRLIPVDGADTVVPQGERSMLVMPTPAPERIARAFAPAPRPSGTITADALERPIRAARDDVERAIIAIWEEFLPGGAIGVDDDFFALGGTSLAAVRIMTQIKTEFAVDLPLEALLGSEPTVATVAEGVRQQLATRDAAASDGTRHATHGDSVESLASADVAADPELEALLSAVEQLSDDEAQAAIVTKDIN